MGGRGRAGGGQGQSGGCSGRQVAAQGGQRADGGNRERQEAAGCGKSHMMEVEAGDQLSGSAAFSAAPSTLANGGQLRISGWGHQM